MWEILLRIPSPHTLCVLYVMINLINVKRTSIAVVVALIILFCMSTSQQGKIWPKTYSNTLPTVLYISSRCVVYSQQLWRGYSAAETELTYGSSIITNNAA